MFQIITWHSPIIIIIIIIIIITMLRSSKHTGGTFCMFLH